MRILELQNPNEFYPVILQLLKSKRVTKEYLGEQLGLSGQLIGKYLSQKRAIPYKHMVAICKVLGIDEIVIFTKDEIQ